MDENSDEVPTQLIELESASILSVDAQPHSGAGDAHISNATRTLRPVGSMVSARLGWKEHTEELQPEAE